MISIQPSRVKGAEFHRNTWCVTPERGASIDDVLSAGYFSHVVAQFRPGDHIEVMPEGREWYAEMVVLGVSRLEAQLGLIHAVDLVSAPAVQIDDAVQDEPTPDGYTIKWAGPKAKFRIQRCADRAVLQDGFDTAAEANRWLADHKAVAA